MTDSDSAQPSDPTDPAAVDAAPDALSDATAASAAPADAKADTKVDTTAEDLERVLEIPLTLKVEIGSSRMQIEELLNLGPGSVIELDKRAGEPVDILISEKMIATGDAVVVNEYFGVRVKDIISQKDRVKSLA